MRTCLRGLDRFRFVGSALSREPGGAPTLYVKGPADKFVRDLVDSSEINIVLAENQPFSFDELEARQQRAHRALEAMGFREVVSGVNITGAGLIPATVSPDPPSFLLNGPVEDRDVGLAG